MNKKGLNTNLLEGGDFKSLSQDVEVNIKDIDYNKEQVESIAENIKYEEKIKDRDLAIFKTSMKKLDNIISSTEMLLDQLSNVSYTQKE
jgi:t-SNARE complex subunit (syntaxin)